METAPIPLDNEPPGHAGKVAERLAHERTLLEEAREDIRAGRVIADDDVDAWLGLFVRGEPLPIPSPPHAE